MTTLITEPRFASNGSPDTSNAMDWNIDSIVSELRQLRDASLAARQRLGKPVKLPSRTALAGIVDGLSAALFPNRLGSRVLANESVDYFVGHAIDVSLRELVDQVVRELQFVSGQDDASGVEQVSDSAAQRKQGIAMVHEFAASLPMIRALLETDIQAAYRGDPAARSVDEVLACYPGITAMVHHRLAHALYTLGAPLAARIIAELAHSKTGIDIHPGAKIAGSFFIDHGTGVVIGETAVIGERVRIYHGVSLGASRVAASTASSPSGDHASGHARHPIVEDDVVIYAGATILGPIIIGRGSVIGGNVWLTSSVPPGSNVSQAKVQSEQFHDGAGI